MTLTPSPYLRITSDITGHTARVFLDGELDYETTPNLEAAVNGLLASRHDVRVLYLDCADMHFCDTMGLAGLLAIRNATDTAEVGLVLDNRTPTFERVLEITGLLPHLTAPPNSESSTGYGNQPVTG